VINGGGGLFSGNGNQAIGELTTIAGGRSNTASGDKSCIGGGLENQASGIASGIASGQYNLADGLESFVGSGEHNNATGSNAVILGGRRNEATGLLSTSGGGGYNFARGQYSVIGGGGGPESFDSNAALGDYATVPGGRRNIAGGDYSFAGGFGAHAEHGGSFVWGGSTGASSSAPEQFIIKASGGVGIMTSNPLGPLHIREEIEWVDAADLQEDDIIVEDDDAIIGLYSGDGGVAGSGIALGETTLLDGLIDKWAILRQTSGGGSGLRITYGADNNPYANSTVVHLNNNGNVGIGMTSPSNRLTLPNIAGSGGRALANRWDTYSSRRWKHDIETIDNAVETIGHLRGVHFKWNENGADDIGLIAEEVGKVVPEVVQYEDNGVDAQSVDYARLVAVLIEAVKEQQREIERLDSEIEQMRR
jgi:hypothetical protein